MTQGPTIVRDPELNEYARRIAAAYTSVWAGYSGVDYLLKRTERVGDFWYAIAEAVQKAFLERHKMRNSKDGE